MDVSALNHFIQLKSTKDEENIETIAHCILYSPNSFKILEIAFDLVNNPNSSEELVSKILQIIHHVLMRFSFYAYRTNKYPSDDLDMFCYNIRTNIEEIIKRIKVNQNSKLRSYQMRFLTRICICHGKSVTTDAFFLLLNTSSRTLTVTNYQTPKLHELIFKLIENLNHKMRIIIDECIKNTLNNSGKTTEYWANLMLFLEKRPIDLDLFELNKFFNYDSINQTIDIYFIIKIYTFLLEKFEHYHNQFLHSIIKLVVNNYLKVLEFMHNPDKYQKILAHNLIELENLSKIVNKSPHNEKIFFYQFISELKNRNWIFADKIYQNEFQPTLMEQLDDDMIGTIEFEYKINENAHFLMFFITALLKKCIKDKSGFALEFFHLICETVTLPAVFYEENPMIRKVFYLFVIIKK